MAEEQVLDFVLRVAKNQYAPSPGAPSGASIGDFLFPDSGEVAGELYNEALADRVSSTSKLYAATYEWLQSLTGTATPQLHDMVVMPVTARVEQLPTTDAVLQGFYANQTPGRTLSTGVFLFAYSHRRGLLRPYLNLLAITVMRYNDELRTYVATDRRGHPSQLVVPSIAAPNQYPQGWLIDSVRSGTAPQARHAAIDFETAIVSLLRVCDPIDVIASVDANIRARDSAGIVDHDGTNTIISAAIAAGWRKEGAFIDMLHTFLVDVRRMSDDEAVIKISKMIFRHSFGDYALIVDKLMTRRPSPNVAAGLLFAAVDLGRPRYILDYAPDEETRRMWLSDAVRLWRRYNGKTRWIATLLAHGLENPSDGGDNAAIIAILTEANDTGIVPLKWLQHALLLSSLHGTEQLGSAMDSAVRYGMLDAKRARFTVDDDEFPYSLSEWAGLLRGPAAAYAIPKSLRLGAPWPRENVVEHWPADSKATLSALVASTANGYDDGGAPSRRPRVTDAVDAGFRPR